MKQIWPNYSYSPTTNVLTLTGLNIDRDQLLLVTAADRGRIMYNFADSATTASAFTAGANTGLTLVASTAGLTTTAALVIYYDDQVSGISGTVTAMAGTNFAGEIYNGIFNFSENDQMGVYVTSPLPTGTNSIGRVTVAGTVTIGAGTAQIGSVTVGNSVTIGSLPAISGTVTANGGDFASSPLGAYPAKALRIGFGDDEQYNAVGIAGGGKPLPVILYNNAEESIGSSVSGSIPLVISGTVTANTFAVQGTAVTTSNFTSTTASTVLANYNATREVLTIFNEGAGNLHIAPGATCTTIAYQVRLSAGDYFEVPSHQSTITHSAVFATAGTARVTQVS
jgi:hypothetical protein